MSLNFDATVVLTKVRATGEYIGLITPLKDLITNTCRKSGSKEWTASNKADPESNTFELIDHESVTRVSRKGNIYNLEIYTPSETQLFNAIEALLENPRRSTDSKSLLSSEMAKHF